MKITLNSKYHATVDNNFLGYVGENNSRTITIENYQLDEADLYKLRLSYPSGIQYDIDISEGKINTTVSMLWQAGTVKAQIIAFKHDGNVYEYVKKSNIFNLEIKESLEGQPAVIPTYEQTIGTLEKVLSVDVEAQKCIDSANAAKESEVNAKISENNASKSANTAIEASDTANSAANMASNASDVATEKATSAENSATVAQNAQVAAETAKNTATTAANTATAKATAAESSAIAAQTAQTAAETAKIAAEIAADECIAARDTAVTAAGTATDKAAVAVDKATEAARSAEISAENASQTAADRAAVESAKTDVLSARETAVSAADTATENAQTAIDNAATANTAAETAVQASNAAQTAKTAAEQAATAAEDNKTTVVNAAQAAAQAADTANSAADVAVSARDTAQAAANTATAKATAAESSAIAAQTAQTAAETAKIAAETAQGVAENKAAEIAESVADIEALKAKSHTHGNKSVLDALGDSDGNLTYSDRVILDLDKFFVLQRTGKVYGVKVYKATANPTSICEKTRDNAGLVCEPSTDTVEGRDDYADIPLFKWYEVNYKRYDDGFAYPTAFIGDSNYKTDNVDMGALQMTFFYNWIDDNDEYRELVISDSPNEALGLKPWELAVRADGTVMPYFIQSRYHSVLGSDGLLHSMHGKIARNQSHDNMITNYQKKGAGYWGAGSNRFTFGQIFNLIKYANKSSQDTMQGVASWNVQHPASVQSEELHNYFPVTNAQAANLQVGLCVSVGYANSANSLDRGVAEVHKYADDVRITAIETLDDDNKAVYLDCEPFSTMPIVTDDLTRQIYMSSMYAHSGDTDCVIDHHDGSPVSNTDSKHPCRIQGVEFLLGAGVIASDTVMYFNEDYSKDVYYAPRGVAHSKVDSVIQSTYTNIGTIPANTDGKGSDWWSGDINQVGGVWYPVNQVSSSGYGNKDICWAGGATASGSKEYYQGGALGRGSYAGFCCLDCWGGRSGANWLCAAAD